MNTPHTSRTGRFLALLAISSLLLPAVPAQTQGTTQQGSAQQGSQQQTPPQQTTPPPAQNNSNVVNIHQMPPPPPPEAPKGAGKNGINMNVDLVQIDASITDKNGAAIKGLKKENFQLQEEGKAQTITALDYYDVERIETAGTTEDATPITIDLKTANDPEKLRPIVREHRMIVLFFDLTSMAPEDLLRSTDAAMKFLKEQMTPADLIAIVTFGTQFRINVDFTNQKELLEHSIAAIANPGKETLLSGLASSASDTVTQDDQSAATADDTEFNIFNTDNKLYAVEALSGLLGGIPGKKAVMEFTGGITQTGEENRSAVQAATDAANKNDVTFYQVDSRGLVTDAADASSGMATGNSAFSGATVLAQVNSRTASRDTLSTLAQDTGGKMFADINNFSTIFKEVQEDTTGYYLLSYYSTNTKRDGRYRGVSVKLVNLPGAKVKHRQGYYAPKDFGIYNTEDREKQLDDAMASQVAVTELPMALDAGEFHWTNNQIFVPISVKLASSALQFAKTSGKHEAKFDFLYELRDVTTKRVAGSQRDTMTVPLEASQQAIVYQGGILVGPGHYILKFLARDNESGRMGTVVQDLTLYPAQANRLQLSSVLLSSQIADVPKKSDVRKQSFGDAAKGKDSPLDVNGQRIVPSVTRVFTSDQMLYVFFQAYAPTKTDPNALRAGLVFFRNGQRFDDTPVVEASEVDAKTHTASFRISLPLGKLPPGRYTVQTVVVEAGGSQAAFGRNYFALRTKPATATPTAAPPAPGGASPKPASR
jgi:VWFA-related protein